MNNLRKFIFQVISRILSLCFFVLLTLSVSAQQLSKQDESYIDSIMNANYKPNGPGAVILIAKKGKPIYKKAYGLANIELNVSNNPEYVFRIGSMSKQFVAVCILKLAQEGKLNLKDDIRKYFSEYTTHGRKITIENLLSHTSGITSYTEKPDFLSKLMIDQSKTELMESFMNDSLLFEPGTDWSYSNSGYVVAGLIIEKVSGISLNDYLQQNIFIPLGMTNTYIGNYETIIHNQVNGYESAGTNKFKPATYMSWTWPYAAGAIVTNVEDLLKWDNALYTDKIVKKEELEKAWRSFVLSNGQLTNYGFGWSTIRFHDVQFITHGGGINGFLSDGIRIPSEQLYIAILSNSTNISPSAYSPSIALRMIGLTIPTPPILKLSKKNLVEYTGVYEMHRAGSRITTNSTEEKMYRYITIKDDSLISQRKGGGKTPLLNVNKDLFIFKDGNNFCQFHRNKKGVIESIELYDEPIQYGPNEFEPKTILPLPKEKQSILLDAKKLELYKGKYDFGGGFFIQVSSDDHTIYIQATGEDKEEIFAENDTTFFLKSVDATIEFIKENGKFTKLILFQGGKYEAKKVE